MPAAVTLLIYASEAAMKEAVENCGVVIAILSGNGPGEAGAAYFERDFCVKELRWAKQAGTRIQPVVDMLDKPRVAEFFAAAPEDLRHLRSIDVVDLNHSDAEYWRVGFEKLLRAAAKHSSASIRGSSGSPSARLTKDESRRTKDESRSSLGGESRSTIGEGSLHGQL